MQLAPSFDVSCLALPPSLRQKLVEAGFTTTSTLKGISPVDLAKELGVEANEAISVARAVNGDSRGKSLLQDAKSALDLLAREHSSRKIVTFCEELDGILGGGIAIRQVTEICGGPGLGKTQIGMQLAIDVQIPENRRGLGGEAVYIDTEGSFFVERARAMAEAFVRHMRKLAAASPEPEQQISALSWESVLQHIHYFRTTDLTEQLATMAGLESFLQQHPQVKLVVIDSMTFHLRQDIQDTAARARLLAQVGQDLMRLAEAHGLAVVLTNHVTTKITTHETRLVPALGDSWAHAATNRLVLFQKDQARLAYLYKSPSLAAATAEYVITSEGVRGRRPQRKRPRP